MTHSTTARPIALLTIQYTAREPTIEHRIHAAHRARANTSRLIGAMMIALGAFVSHTAAAQDTNPCSDLRKPDDVCVQTWRCSAADHAWWPQTLTPKGTACTTISGQKGTCPGGTPFMDELPVCIASSAKPSGTGAGPGPQVRMRWQDFIKGAEGAKRLTSLTAAVAKMKSLDSSAPNTADFRRSWHYWANIHGYYGSSSVDGTVEAQIQYLQSQGLQDYLAYYQGIVDQTPPDAAAQTIWATCQHSDDGNQAVNFFAWHRMYLYYFERVLRWAAGDDTLRLPYWDYTNPSFVALPAEFQNSSSVLYDSRRNASLNDGSATLNPNSTNVDSLFSQSDYFSYESSIESGIHGYVHCTVGPLCPVAHMGDVPVAANDPIFYEHHANIDRLWACWQKLHPTPSGAWQNQSFQFVDETGTLKSMPVSAVLDTAALGYVYDNDSQCLRTAAPAIIRHAIPGHLLMAEGVAEVAVLGTTPSVQITHPQTSIDIPVPKEKVRTLFVQPGPTDLILRDVTAAGPPGVQFDVYIATKDKPTVRKFVGTISWFGVFHHHGSDASMKRTLTFDVTDPLRKLGGTANTSGITLTIQATTGRVPVNSSKIEVMTADASKAFRPQANVQIGAIELRQAVSAP
jgi:hypothetical protein